MMREPSHEKVIDLAFAFANSEDLPAEDRRLLDQMQAGSRSRDELDQYARIISEAREALDASRLSPGEEPEPIDDNTLAEYLDGALSAEEKESVEARLVNEPGALRQLIGLADLLPEDDERGHAIAYVFEMLGRALRMLSHPGEGFELMPLQPAAVLGPETESSVQVWTQDLGPIRIQCTLQCTADKRLGLTVKLVSPDAPPQGMRISLRMEGKLLQSDVVPSSGEVTLHDLGPATYELEIAVPSTNVVSIEFDFRDRGV